MKRWPSKGVGFIALCEQRAQIPSAQACVPSRVIGRTLRFDGHLDAECG